MGDIIQIRRLSECFGEREVFGLLGLGWSFDVLSIKKGSEGYYDLPHHILAMTANLPDTIEKMSSEWTVPGDCT